MKKELWFFTSKTCVACKSAFPLLESLTDIPIIKIDVEEETDKASQYSIMSLPTILYMVDGVPQKN